jgi:hypothetical protein
MGTFLVLFADVDSTFAGIALIVGGLAAFAQAVLYFRIWGVDEGSVKAEIGTKTEPGEMAKEYTEEFSSEEADGEIEETELDESDEYSLLEEELSEDDAEMDDEIEESVSEIEEAIAQEHGRVSTTLGFDIDLPPEVLSNIRQSLEQTDTEGFIPVVGFDQFGRIILSFEPSNS